MHEGLPALFIKQDANRGLKIPPMRRHAIASPTGCVDSPQRLLEDQ